MVLRGFLRRRSSRRIEVTGERLGWRSAADLADVERLEREAPLFDMGNVQNVRASFPDPTDADRPRH
jgi:hypothetical protein